MKIKSTVRLKKLKITEKIYKIERYCHINTLFTRATIEHARKSKIINSNSITNTLSWQIPMIFAFKL